MMLIVLGLAGCGSDMNVASSPDLAVCRGGVTAPKAATACGFMTCAPGSICVAHQPGTAVPADLAPPGDGGGGEGGGGGYDPYQHSCLVLPPECQRCGGCGEGMLGVGGRYFGCFATICSSYETGCRFDGATLTCIGL